MKMSYNEWQPMTTSDNEWQRVIEGVTTSGTTNYNKWQQATTSGFSANSSFFRIRDEYGGPSLPIQKNKNNKNKTK